MSMIKGITVQLKKKIQTGTDAFGNPIYDYQTINVDNVLIGEPSADDVTSEMSLYGKNWHIHLQFLKVIQTYGKIRKSASLGQISVHMDMLHRALNQ